MVNSMGRFIGELPSSNTMHNGPKNSSKPADFRQILQFTCGCEWDLRHEMSSNNPQKFSKCI